MFGNCEEKGSYHLCPHDEWSNGRLLGGHTARSLNTGGVPNVTNTSHGIACAGIIGASHDNGLGMLSLNPNLTEPQVRTKLQQTATDMGSGGFDNTFGYGRLNAYAAVTPVLPTSFIPGPSQVCPSASYSITNQPAVTMVSWSSSNTSILTINAITGTTTRVGNGRL